MSQNDKEIELANRNHQLQEKVKIMENHIEGLTIENIKMKETMHKIEEECKSKQENWIKKSD